jgi:DNA-binding SARP family transcriptional activator
MSHVPARSNKTLLRLYVLGGFRIEFATHPLILPTHKMESLLAYIALHPEPIVREKLAALIWCDSPKDQARSSLRNALPVLRKRLGDDLLSPGNIIQEHSRSAIIHW